MPAETKAPELSETVRRLRETFASLARRLKAEDEPAPVYSPARQPTPRSVPHDRS